MIGVGILAFNRPQYLRRLLASLEEQTDLDGVEFHLYLDGAVNKHGMRRYAEQRDIDRCARLFDRLRVRKKWAHIHSSNVGVGINSFEAIESLVNSYDQVMLLEDDIVLSPHWFRLAQILYAELAQHPDVFSFSPGFIKHSQDQDALISKRAYMWCECFTADRWRRMRAVYLDFYIKFIKGVDYYDRDLGGIRAWHLAQGIEEGVLSQDAGRLTALRVSGMHRVQCAANRALGIGKLGVHFSPGLYAQQKIGQQVPFIFADDATRERFVWND